MNRSWALGLALLLLSGTTTACGPDADDPVSSTTLTHRMSVPGWGISIPASMTATSGATLSTPGRCVMENPAYGQIQVDKVDLYLPQEGCQAATSGHNPAVLHSPEQSNRPDSRVETRIPGGTVVEVRQRERLCTNGCSEYSTVFAFVTWDQPAAGKPRTIVLRWWETDNGQRRVHEMALGMRQL